MKIALLSDLHLEIATYQICKSVLENADVIVLAGDISTGLRGLHWASGYLEKTNAQFIYVPGNHEFYHHDIVSLREEMKVYTAQLQKQFGKRIHLLDDASIEINGVRFLGATLWTDFHLFGQELQMDAMFEGQNYLNDFQLIRNGEWNFTVQDSLELHRQSLAWLTQELTGKTYAGHTIVVTHHSPSWGSVVPRFAKSLLSACFASRLEHLMGYSRYWFHGHMHDSLNYEINGTKVICNPRGYARYSHDQENADFENALIVEIDNHV